MLATVQGMVDVGDFVLAVFPADRHAQMAQRMAALRLPSQEGPPEVHALGKTALAATWGGATVQEQNGIAIVGLLQAASKSEYSALLAQLRQLGRSSAGVVTDRVSALAANFAAGIVELNTQRVAGITDPFRRVPLYHLHESDLAALASDARLLAALQNPDQRPEADLRSLYHYLNFSYIPAPFSIFPGIGKLRAGTVARRYGRHWREDVYWRPRFAEDYIRPGAVLETEFRETLFDTVRRYRPRDGMPWGAFLSGGTDSSSITGILATEPGQSAVQTFSIGFTEPGYDELEYAEIAARHYGAESHTRRVSEADAVALSPRLAKIFDEPYGNASAIPTFFCASAAAAEGIGLMLAGDGGDESFGGNERYAKDAVYRRYASLPQWVRRALAGPKPLGEQGGRFGARVRNFLRRGAMPNPDRFYSDDSFASDYFDALLPAGVQAALQRDASLNFIRDVYDDADAVSDLHRLMYIDLMMTIADNDLTKVYRATRAAGVAVLYPYLDSHLVRFAGRLPAKWKVNGTRKRYLFKRALRDVLPDAILRKPKQGFALPIADWARRDGVFQHMLFDTLLSNRFRQRGLVEPGFVERLIEAHRGGSWDYSPELWRLFMLESWYRENMDA